MTIMLILSDKVNTMQLGKKNQILHPTTYVKETYYNKLECVGTKSASPSV